AVDHARVARVQLAESRAVARPRRRHPPRLLGAQGGRLRAHGHEPARPELSQDIHVLVPSLGDAAGGPAVNRALTPSMVSASAAGLSWRQGRMRGKRTATPERCREEGAMPSKASSKTCVGSTALVGPNRSRVWRRTQASSSAISASERPEYARAMG